MNNSLENAKLEIIEWVTNLDDSQIIAKLFEIKNNEKTYSAVAEPQAEYLVKDSFEEQWAKAISGEKLLAGVYEHIDSLNWKNSFIYQIGPILFGRSYGYSL